VAYADTRAEAERLRDLFVERFGDAHPAAADTLMRDWPRMVTLYDFPREHWKHLRTTNPVESPFAAVRWAPTPASATRRSPTPPR
jgi:transposase-like protein